MKFIHLSDLHIGKRVNEFSMIEEQKYILLKILEIIDNSKAEAVMIAGDVYDKTVPSTEAVELFDWFVTKLAERNLKIFIISGNHDSSIRVAFASEIMKKCGVYISPAFSKDIKPTVLNDEYGEINVYMLPFIKPANVRAFYQDEQIDSYTDAVRIAIENMNVDSAKRNIIITHQFVTGATRCDSEELSVGGTDNVDVSIFDNFDYVALGHIHSPQKILRETVRYSGTPLKYSFSECNHKKSVCVVDMFEKDNVNIELIPLIPKNDLQKIRGSYMELTAKSFYDELSIENYFHITLTDEEDIPDVISKLRTIYPNIMRIEYDNKRTRSTAHIDSDERIEKQTPLEIFDEFYFTQNGSKLSNEQNQMLCDMIEKIWEGNV